MATSSTSAPEAEVRLILPPSVTVALQGVLEKTGDKVGEVFGKALGLYLLALAAKERGLHVGSAESPESLETEFVGF